MPLSAWLLLPASLLGAELRIEVAPAPGPPCPTVEALRGALAARVPAGLDGATYVVRVRGLEGAVEVALVDEAGGVRLVRRLPRAGGGCAGIAEAAAAIVDRQLRGVGWAAPPAPPPPARRAPPGAPGGAGPAPALAARTSACAGAGGRPARLTAAVGATSGTSHGLWGRGAADLRARAGGPLELAVGALFPGRRVDEALGGGRIELRAVGVRAAAQVAAGWGRLLLRAGPEALVTFESVRTVGIPSPGAARRTVVALGPGLQVGWPLGPRLGVAVEAAGLLGLGPAFTVRARGAARSALPLPRWQATLGLRLLVALFP
jgi:hypothetical protein